MMTLAQIIGLDVPDTELIELDEIGNMPGDVTKNDGKALAIRRLDRLDDGSAVHIEDFAQISGSSYDV